MQFQPPSVGGHHRRHGHHHRYLLGQPVEDVRHGLHGRLQLQGLSFHAGAGRSASPTPPGPDPRSLPSSARGWAPAELSLKTPGGTLHPLRRPPRTPSQARPLFPSRSLEEPGKSPRSPWPAFPGRLSRGGACLSPDPRGGRKGTRRTDLGGVGSSEATGMEGSRSAVLGVED